MSKKKVLQKEINLKNVYYFVMVRNSKYKLNQTVIQHLS